MKTYRVVHEQTCMNTTLRGLIHRLVTYLVVIGTPFFILHQLLSAILNGEQAVAAISCAAIFGVGGIVEFIALTSRRDAIGTRIVLGIVGAALMMIALVHGVAL